MTTNIPLKASDDQDTKRVFLSDRLEPCSEGREGQPRRVGPNSKSTLNARRVDAHNATGAACGRPFRTEGLHHHGSTIEQHDVSRCRAAAMQVAEHSGAPVRLKHQLVGRDMREAACRDARIVPTASARLAVFCAVVDGGCRKQTCDVIRDGARDTNAARVDVNC